jgi:hypothetical protein
MKNVHLFSDPRLRHWKAFRILFRARIHSVSLSYRFMAAMTDGGYDLCWFRRSVLFLGDGGTGSVILLTHKGVEAHRKQSVYGREWAQSWIV